MAHPRMAEGVGPSGFHETYRQEYVRCGKPACARCPHGPYWYAYWTDAEGRTRKRYVGKFRDGRRRPTREERRREEERREQQRREEERREQRRREEERRATPPPRGDDARDAATLGVAPNVAQAELKRAYRRAVLEAHPDRGGSHARMVEINLAYERMMKRRGWWKK